MYFFTIISDAGPMNHPQFNKFISKYLASKLSDDDLYNIFKEFDMDDNRILTHLELEAIGPLIREEQEKAGKLTFA